MHRNASASLVLVALLSLAACSDGPIQPGAEPPISLAIVSGGDQTGPPGEELPEPLVVQATREEAGSTVPIPSHVVNFRIVEGDGSVFAGTAATDENGYAQDYWTLGTAEGLNRLEVRSVDPTTGEKFVHALFEATGVIGGGEEEEEEEEPTGTEICNGVDDDGDGVIDDSSWGYCLSGVPAPNTNGMNSCSPFYAENNGSPADGCEAAQGWDQTSNMPFGVRAAAAATDGTAIYVFGGNAGTSSRTAHTQIFVPSTGAWTTGAALPAANEWGTAVYADGMYHLLGGNADTGAPSERHWIYDPVLDSWSDGPDMPHRAAGAASAVIDRTIIVAGGIDRPGAGYADHMQLFDLDLGVWTLGTPAPAPTVNWQGANVGGYFLVAGGLTPGRQTEQTLHSYDLAADTWSALPDMPNQNEAYAATEVNGFYCTVGGRIGQSSGFAPPHDRIDCYDPDTETWVAGPPLPLPLQETAVAAVDGVLFVMGGRYSSDGVARFVFRIRP